MSKPRVFLIQTNTRFDTTAAEQFGSRVFLMAESHVSPFSTEEFLAELLKSLDVHGYDPVRDFIGLTGPSIGVALLLAAVAARHPVIQTLMFDAKSASYKARIVAIPQAARA